MAPEDSTHDQTSSGEKTIDVTSPLLSNDNAAVIGALIDALENASPGLVLSGEKGVGKEAVVQLLYGRSALCGYPFIKVNCPILTPADKTDRTPCIQEITTHPNHSSFSLFRIFHQGVLYLHAVDQLSAELQERLLIIIRRKFSAVASAASGSLKQLAILSTASRSLQSCVADGAFHPDLCELLSGVSIHIPPLRNSPERIGNLVDYFLARSAMREKIRRFPQPSSVHLAKMQAYHWPGNVRELQALVARAVHDKDWDAAIATLDGGQSERDNYAITQLTPESAALMPHFEVRRGHLLERLSEKVAPEELGLMDLVWYEEMVASNKPH